MNKFTFLKRTSLTLTIISLGATTQADVTITGDNGFVTDHCTTPNFGVTSLPSSCSNLAITAYNNISTPDNLTISTDSTTAVAIGTTLTLNNNYTGSPKSGLVTIDKGSKLQTAFTYISFEKDSSGVVNINGSNSIMNVHSGTSVGHYGNGELNIIDGGKLTQINPDYFFAGYGESATSTITVSGVDQNTGDKSTLTTRNRGYIGYYGDATLNILDGGSVFFEYSSSLAEYESSKSIINIEGVNQTGDRSHLAIGNNQFWLGWEGKGIVNVKNGGLFSVQDGIQLGGNASGSGLLYVDGINANTNNRSTVTATSLSSGYASSGQVYISNGGLVQLTDYVAIGDKNTSNGFISVDGSADGIQSTLQTQGTLYVGSTGDGRLDVTNGGLVTTKALLSANNYNKEGVINVDGKNSSLKVLNNQAVIGQNGKGVLNLSNEGEFHSDVILLANAAGTSGNSTGIINIGNGSKAGKLYTNTIRGLSGDAQVNFNQTDDIEFSTALIESLDVNHESNATTTLSSNQNTYSGDTTISAGTLKAGLDNAFSANSNYSVEKNGTLDLNNFNQTINNIENSGSVRLGNTASNTLNVTEDFDGYNGVLYLSTVLGDDNSQTDKVFIGEEAEGSTELRIRNIGGTGAQTVNGIHIIQTRVSDDNAFYIANGGYVTAGAYDYGLNLKKAGTNANQTTFDNWYLESHLRNTNTPIYTPDVGEYLATETMGNTLFTSRLEDREGASQYQNLGNSKDVGNVWVRAYGGHNQFKTMESQLKTTGNSFVTQMGTALVTLGEQDQYNLGAMTGFAYYDGKTRSSLTDRESKTKIDGYSLGFYGTWYAHPVEQRGTYIDSWVLWNKFNNSIDTPDQNKYKFNSSGVTASLEVGGDYLINKNGKKNWWVQPQSQIIYQGVHAENFQDAQGVDINHGKDNVQMRMGVKTYLDIPTSGNKFTSYRPYIAVNYIQNTNPYSVVIHDERYENEGSKKQGEIKFGIEGNTTKNSQVWLNASYATGSHNNEAYQGNIGWKYNF